MKPQRKYEVTLPDGRVVSRQYASQLRNKESTRKRQKAYYEANKDKVRERNRQWKESTTDESGLNYSQRYYIENREKLSEANRARYLKRKEAKSNENPQQ